MQSLGRLLQLLALIGLPVTIPLQLNHVINVAAMVGLMVGSICLFYIGRLIEGYARP
jgi:membrane protein DedA with SNARE-associated domain